MEYCVYVLESCAPGRRRYVGCTPDPRRRLRQHNGEIAGGAKATRGRGPWRFAALLTGFGADRREALRAEWRVKREARARRAGAAGVLEALSAFDGTAWTASSTGSMRGGGLTLLHRAEHREAAAAAAAAFGWGRAEMAEEDGP